MELSELYNTYSNYSNRIEDLWRSLWTWQKKY